MDCPKKVMAKNVYSIPHLEKPKNRRFSHKNPKMFDFRFNTPIPFPESGSRKRFHILVVRAIDFSHDFTALGPLLRREFTTIRYGLSLQNPINFNFKN